MSIKKLGKYYLLERLASGGMAEVHLSMGYGAEGVQKFFAIKKILADFSSNMDFIEMFKDEAKVASQLTHSNILSIFDFGVDRVNEFFIVMEFVNGKNLKQIVTSLEKHQKHLSIPHICYIIKEVANGLNFAHAAKNMTTGEPLNVIHRDISPQNIMLSFGGDVKIIDFGIAKVDGKTEETKAGSLKGKYAYMSPEQVSMKSVDHRTDIFSLGVVFWELLTGKRLFEGVNEIEKLASVQKCIIPKVRPLKPEVSEELERIVLKCLQKDPKGRYQTGQELANDLSRYLIMAHPEFNEHQLEQFLTENFKTEDAQTKEKIIKYSQMDLAYEVLQRGDDENHDGLNRPGRRKDRGSSQSSLQSVNFSIKEVGEYYKLQTSWKLRGIYALIGILSLAAVYLIFVYVPEEQARLKVGRTQVKPSAESPVTTQYKNFEKILPGVVSLTARGNQLFAGTADGKYYAWGNNRFNQLGIKTPSENVNLVEITNFPKWKVLAVNSYHSCGIAEVQLNSGVSNVLKCWGDNTSGQVGDPSEKNVAIPTTIETGVQYRDVATGLYHTCGITVAGVLKCWGRGDFAQLGQAQITAARVPVLVDPTERYQKVFAGSYHTCAIKNDGKLRCWGRNDFGQLGNGAINYKGTLTDVDKEAQYVELALGEYHTCGLSYDYKLKCWGKNDFGQLGQGHNEPSTVPQPTGPNLVFKSIKASKFHTCGLTNSNDLYCWGRNHYYQITDNEVDQIRIPIKVAKLPKEGQFALGETSTCYLIDDKVRCRGFHLGQGTEDLSGSR